MATGLVGRCPYCGQVVGSSELHRIERHEEERLREALEQANAESENRHQAQVAGLRSQLEAAEEQAARLPDLVEERIAAERERIVEQAAADHQDRIKELEERLNEVQAEATAEVEERVNQLVGQNDQLTKSFTLIQQQLERSEKGAEELRRQLERTRAPHETGGLAEEELERRLQLEFPRDRIDRTPRGASGADVAQRVLEDGLDCGVILFECKDTKSWQNSFVTKLTADKTTSGAAYAILVSTAMPPKSTGFAALDEVTVVQPRFVLDLVHIIRDTLVIAKKAEAAGQGSGFKGEELLSFLQSPEFTNRVRAALKAIGDLEALQSQEKRRHELLWQKQTAAQATVRKQINDVQTEITKIIVGS